MTDAVEITRSLAGACAAVKQSLTDTQQIVIAGALAVWLEKVRQEAGRGSILEIVRRERRIKASAETVAGLNDLRPEKTTKQ